MNLKKNWDIKTVCFLLYYTMILYDLRPATIYVKRNKKTYLYKLILGYFYINAKLRNCVILIFLFICMNNIVNQLVINNFYCNI